MSRLTDRPIKFIHLISRVRGPDGELWTEFWPKREARRPWKQGRKKRGSITCLTDRANKANKMFIIWLCWLFRFESKRSVRLLTELELTNHSTRNQSAINLLIYLLTYLFISLFVCLFICLFMYVCMYVCICLFIYFIRFYFIIYLFISYLII